MKHDFKPYLNSIFIETGSYLGDGIQAALDAGFTHVISIELSSYYYSVCQDRFKNNSRVELVLGDSVIVLPEVIKGIHEQCTFWIDAHYSGGDTATGIAPVPMMEELEIIFKHEIKTHTIIIDDMRAVGVGGDTSWGRLNKKKIEELILSINSEYKIHYEFGVEPNDILIATIDS
jgi:hypothetical protein